MAYKTALAAGIFNLLLSAVLSGQPQPQNSGVGSASAERALLDQYCVGCHSETAKAARAEAARKLTLDDLDVAHVEKAPAEWEIIVRKLRAGMMPPSGMPRPNGAGYESMIAWL